MDQKDYNFLSVVYGEIFFGFIRNYVKDYVCSEKSSAKFKIKNPLKIESEILELENSIRDLAVLVTDNSRKKFNVTRPEFIRGIRKGDFSLILSLSRENNA